MSEKTAPKYADKRPDEKPPKIKEPSVKKDEAPQKEPPAKDNNPNTPRIVDPGPV